tara:strand:- start:100 stop:387 length:288 start_codon:yes stop_codon:yes gene_type:complete
MIKATNFLNQEDWKGLNGNDLYVSMLRNKTYVDCDNNQLDIVKDYLENNISGLCYVDREKVYGYYKVYVYFENPIDRDNYVATCNTILGLDKIKT